jgi:hypothetical protein
VTEADRLKSDVAFVRAEMRERFGFPWVVVLPLIVKFLPVLIELVQYLFADRMAGQPTPVDAQREAEAVVVRMGSATRTRYAIHRIGRVV